MNIGTCKNSVIRPPLNCQVMTIDRTSSETSLYHEINEEDRYQDLQLMKILKFQTKNQGSAI